MRKERSMSPRPSGLAAARRQPSAGQVLVEWGTGSNGSLSSTTSNPSDAKQQQQQSSNNQYNLTNYQRRQPSHLRASTGTMIQADRTLSSREEEEKRRLRRAMRRSTSRGGSGISPTPKRSASDRCLTTRTRSNSSAGGVQQQPTREELERKQRRRAMRRSTKSDLGPGGTTPTRSLSDRCLMSKTKPQTSKRTCTAVVRKECVEQLVLSQSSSKKSLMEVKDERKQQRRAMRRSTSNSSLMANRSTSASSSWGQGQVASDGVAPTPNRTFKKSSSFRGLGGGSSDFMAQLKQEVVSTTTTTTHRTSSTSSSSSRQQQPPSTRRMGGKSPPPPPTRRAPPQGLGWLNETLNTSLRNVCSAISGDAADSDSDNEEEQEDSLQNNQYYTEQYEKYQYTPADVVSLVTDPAAFRTLQKSLRQRHLVTNIYLEQNLHFYIKHIKDVRTAQQQGKKTKRKL